MSWPMSADCDDRKDHADVGERGKRKEDGGDHDFLMCPLIVR